MRKDIIAIIKEASQMGEAEAIKRMKLEGDSTNRNKTINQSKIKEMEKKTLFQINGRYYAADDIQQAIKAHEAVIEEICEPWPFERRWDIELEKKIKVIKNVDFVYISNQK